MLCERLVMFFALFSDTFTFVHLVYATSSTSNTQDSDIMIDSSNVMLDPFPCPFEFSTLLLTCPADPTTRQRHEHQPPQLPMPMAPQLPDKVMICAFDTI